MKLLLDQNLSPRLIAQLSDIYPNVHHVQNVGLAQASDDTVWQYAREENLIIVTKDVDFHERSVLLGAPPKVVWIRRGNCSTNIIEAILRKHQTDIETLFQTDNLTFLMLF